jgi:bacterioferritin-associated ferredoxin
MIICICRNISESEIKQAILAKESHKDYTKRTGCSRQCGTCSKDVKQLFKEVNRK